jgi:hypothetical protein
LGRYGINLLLFYDNLLKKLTPLLQQKTSIFV